MDEKKYKISFPHMGNYYVPIYNLLDNVIDHETSKIIVPKKISKNTIEIGNNVSPDSICVPFKYNMGNFIESLNMGANVIIQAGGGCRYGYYSEVQEQILNDLGYKFMYISILDAKGVNPYKVYKKFKIINPKLKFTKFLYRFLVTVKLVEILDEIETYIRENISYEKVKGEFNQILDELLKEMHFVKNLSSSEKLKKKYINRLKQVSLRQESQADLKIGIVGELYTSMEPSSTYFLEEELNNMGIRFKRYTTVTYLLFQKGKAEKKLLKSSSKYIDYALGADGTESVAHTLELIDKGYDGIIHIKPFGCTPEVNAIPILQKISEDTGIPIMFLSFDSQTSNTGIKTRLEAFYDMLKMKKESMEQIK